MATLKSYRELVAWQKSIRLAKTIYGVTRGFPSEEKFGLTSQIRRAVVSIPANIAEGQARNSSGEFRQALGIAQGSLAELETLVILSLELGLVSADVASNVLRDCSEVGKLINGLLRSLTRRA